ncbi:LAMI_0E04566g1_1 [Lachancea mirantina]|uniref:LAMI_0E04566g1_1 n=1 Tax=Lachancea mirantina TaxID=1230905 RepID=A0A1G4JKF7_9SACH|nr:LAMI_0E04566g1_1 [Lachancea mirantina]
MATAVSFTTLSHQLTSDLQTLASESKRRNSEIRYASEKSIKILKTVHSFQELSRHPDFVSPFIQSCSSKNAKCTTISMHCFQRLSVDKCIPSERIPDVLQAFSDSTRLAVEIQLKVLQILPMFFKTYSDQIIGPLSAKLLVCCTDLLQIPNKAPMVVGTASATLQQLVNSMFERSRAEEVKEYEVATSNSDFMKVGPLQYDINRIFHDLCSLNGTTDKSTILKVSCIPEEYGLEILESLFQNHASLLRRQLDLQFILRTKAVPLLLRSYSSSKHFPLVVRSSRCIALLIRVDFLKILELELEVILSLLVHTLSENSDSPHWKKILSLEVIQIISKDFDLLLGIYLTYDNIAERKDILSSLLSAFLQLLTTKPYEANLHILTVLPSLDMALISQEHSVARIPFIELLDKATAPYVDENYILYLVLSISNSISDKMGLKALSLSQGEKNETLMKKAVLMFSHVFHELLKIHEKWLYAASLDTSLFRSVVRSFQRLGQAAGIFGLSDMLSQCLQIFCVAVIQIEEEVLSSPPEEEGYSSSNGVFTALADTFSEPGLPSHSVSHKSQALQRPRYQRTIGLFRAMISLSISLGSSFTVENWRYVLVAWQWTAHYSEDETKPFDSSNKSPQKCRLSKSDITAIESSVSKLVESTETYSNESFSILIESMMTEARNTLRLDEDSDLITETDFRPLDKAGSPQNCKFNRNFFLSGIGIIAEYNSGRLTESKGQRCWSKIVDFLIEIASRRHSDSSFTTSRLCAASALTNLLSEVAVGFSDAKNTQDREIINLIQEHILNALQKLIKAIVKLGISKDDVYSGTVNTEFEIIFLVLRTLKRFLDDFGESMKSSWDMVFEILNSPFMITGGNLDLTGFDGVEDNSMLEVMTTKNNSMIQMSFDVFKLITDDFLQTLPLKAIESLIDTLVHFVSQKEDLNISFSSISQFWIVGDYLRVCIESTDQSQKSLSPAFLENLFETSTVKALTNLAQNKFEKCNALWLYLLENLIRCSSDPRIEVKSGALQTFFRIVDSHSSCFPPWDVVALRVVKPMVEDASAFKDNAQYAEFVHVKLNGLVHLFETHLNNPATCAPFMTSWLAFIEYMKSLTSRSSFDVTFAVFVNFKLFLEVAARIQDVPVQIIEQCYKFWSGYDIVYTDYSAASEFKRKTSYDCIEQLLSCYPSLHTLLVQKKLFDGKKMEAALNVLNTAARYPLLPGFASDHKKPSSLQSLVLQCLDVFDINLSCKLEALFLAQLSAFVVLPFDARQKIEMKLAPKLTSASSSAKVPSFEAVSYKACLFLHHRLITLLENNAEFLDPKHILRLSKNLQDVVKAKSLINLDEHKNVALWCLASQCFYIISRKVIESAASTKLFDPTADFKAKFGDNFLVFAVAPIIRINANVDALTEGDDIIEFQNFNKLFFQGLENNVFGEELLDYYASEIRKSSFFYELDEIEDAIVRDSSSLGEVTTILASFPFDEVLGSTNQPPLLTKVNLTKKCVETLADFMISDGKASQILRRTCLVYFVSRCAFALRRFISIVSLLNEAPVSKVTKGEIYCVLSGFLNVARHLKVYAASEELNELGILYALILKTIPSAHKVKGVQLIIQELSLTLTQNQVKK